MKIPKEIAYKVSEHQNAVQKANNLWIELTEWFDENANENRVDIERIYIAEKPTGRKCIEDGEYCEQHECGYSGDSFYGEYYHQIEGSNKYIGYHYSC